MSQFNVFRQFERLTFRGIELSAITYDSGLSHELAKHKYIFKDDKRVQPLGRENLTFRARVVFSERRAPNDYAQFFFRFLEAMDDRSPGPLVTPDRGEVTVNPVRYQYNYDASRMVDGTIVDVEWILSPQEEPTALEGPGFSPAFASGEQVEAALEDFDEIPEEKKALVNPLRLAAGINQQIIANIDRVTNKIDAQIQNVLELIDTIEALADISNWSVIALLKDHEANLRKVKERLGFIGGEPIKFYVVDFAAPLSEIASRLGRKPSELIKSNRGLAASPTVERGTIIRYV